MCFHVHVWVCMPLPVHLEVRSMFGPSFHHDLEFRFGRTSWVLSAQALSVPIFPHCDFRCPLPKVAFSMSAGDLNSCFHSCEAATLPSALFLCLMAFLCPLSFTHPYPKLLFSLTSTGFSVDSCALGVAIRASLGRRDWECSLPVLFMGGQMCQLQGWPWVCRPSSQCSPGRG